MKVLFIVSAFPRAPGDVITPWLVELIHRLRERSITVEVLAPAYRGQGSHVLHGVQVHRFRYAPAVWETLTHDQTAPDRIRKHPHFLGLVPGYILSGSLAAARLASGGDFDVVHAFWPVPHGVIGMAARYVAGVPLVCTFFGVELTWIQGQLPLLRPVLRQIVRAADAVTAISTYTAQRLQQVAPWVTPSIIPFGAAVGAPLMQVQRVPRSAADAFEILFVGRLVERKGVHILLRAVAYLDESPPVRVRVVGDGPERAVLEATAVELGLEASVSFEGLVPREQLEERLASCDVLVLPAIIDAKGDTEGLGVVLLEAFSFGKPVIASAAGGIVDIVRPGISGLVVPPGEPEALAEAIVTCMRSPDRAAAMGAAGREQVEREFSWPVILDRLENVYQEVTRRRRGFAAVSPAASDQWSASR